MRIGAMAATAALLGVFALAACDPAPEPADAPATAEPGAPATLSGFTHAIEGDLSGYYMPVTGVEVGQYKLAHLFVGQAHEFDAWEKGDRSQTFAPVMFVFEDTSSPMVSNELGGEAHSLSVRVLPSAYAVTNGALRFAGSAPELGEVTFEGPIDAGALATARRNLGASEAPVLTGTLRVGGRTFEAQQFGWWVGD